MAFLKWSLIAISVLIPVLLVLRVLYGQVANAGSPRG